MEIKATLNKPYTQKEKERFIAIYNGRMGFIIEFRDDCIVALGLTQEEEEAKEKERIQGLSVTKSDFFDATIKAFNLDSNDLLPIIANIVAQVEVPDVQKKIALNNYQNAKDFYRCHEIFNVLAGTPLVINEQLTITITSEQFDRYFDRASRHDSDAYQELLPPTNTEEEQKLSITTTEEDNNNELQND